MTIAITIGRWGGVYFHHDRFIWRLCLGFVAVDLWPCEYDDRLAVLLGDHDQPQRVGSTESR